MKCNNCSREVEGLARFCSFCGAMMPESPQTRNEYEQAIRGYLLDGVLEAKDSRELALLRNRLNISEETHQELLKGFDYVTRNTIVLSVDISRLDSFRVPRKCQFRIRITNQEAYPIHRCTFSYRNMQNGELKQLPSFSIGSRSSVQESFFFLAEREGQYELSGYIDVDDAQSHSYRYQFKGINFTVGARSTYKHTITTKDVQTTISDSSSDLQPGLNFQENWVDCFLKPIPLFRNGVFHLASFAGQFAALQDCRLHVQRASGEVVVELFSKNALTFGRDKKRSMSVLALEPTDPPHIYHRNVQKNQCVSGKHLSFLKKGDMVQVCDLGSKFGTMRNGEPCYRLSLYPIQTGDRITVAQVIELEAHVFRDVQSTEPTALHLKRVNNSSHKSHLLLFDSIGLWPEHPSFIGPLHLGATESPLQIRMIDSVPCLCNVSCGTIHVQGFPLHNGEATPFFIGQRIDLKSCKITISTI